MPHSCRIHQCGHPGMVPGKAWSNVEKQDSLKYASLPVRCGRASTLICRLGTCSTPSRVLMSALTASKLDHWWLTEAESEFEVVSFKRHSTSNSQGRARRCSQPATPPPPPPPPLLPAAACRGPLPRLHSSSIFHPYEQQVAFSSVSCCCPSMLDPPGLSDALARLSLQSSSALAGLDDVLCALQEVRVVCEQAPPGSPMPLHAAALTPCLRHSCLPSLRQIDPPHPQALHWPVRHAALAAQLGVRWPKGLLLHGPPGCGKTAAVHAVAAECGAALHVLTAATVVGAFMGTYPSFPCLLCCACSECRARMPAPMHNPTNGGWLCRRVGAAAA